MKTLGFIFQSAPHGSVAGREGVDAVLASAAYCEQIKVFFLADGVLQLLSGQQPEHILSRSYAQSFKLFELYDIEDIYICQTSLQERGLVQTSLLMSGELLLPTEIRAQLGKCDQIMVF
ncbi:sulfurtransferase complex subunit TusC [Thaumasiovibrio sp. DFM-14]|uniref:sulfurtransferase complex subunit TusC n=1 Tax=Thaumasiovibrio sp. DFM-14 TaxID=3384792 RepID=UPI0039A1CC0D